MLSRGESCSFVWSCTLQVFYGDYNMNLTMRGEYSKILPGSITCIRETLIFCLLLFKLEFDFCYGVERR